MEGTKFSILVPAYKAAFLQECIKSILGQTYGNLEVIIVNDASPENITEIVEGFEDSRIRYFVNERNCGAEHVVDNWNRCLEHASGDFCICMGDDDMLLPDCLATYKTLTDKHQGLDVFHTKTVIIDQESKPIDMQEGRPETESVYSLIWHDLKGLRNQFIGDFLFRTQALKEVGGFYDLPFAWSSDHITVAMLAERNGIANTNTPGFLYRHNSRTISRSTANCVGKVRALIAAQEWYYKFLGKEASDEYDELYRRASLPLVAQQTERGIVGNIAKDIRQNPGRLFYWIGSEAPKGTTSRAVRKGIALAAMQALGIKK